ncbi:unnamed protein product [Haemonchus placei]|uniref:Reverse transcriptase domain-containing protein n=1 Tax=Haemonchus placei TaxID=6290 RepID=A0A0N4W2E1_HAEPC|nr:unnamed protein product [Haemonchus placei]
MKVKKIMQDFHDAIEIRDKKISVKFLWGMNHMDLSDNYKAALSRLHQLYNSLRKNDEIWPTYSRIIEEQLQRNIIEDVPHSDNSSSYRTYKYYYEGENRRIVLDANSKKVGQLSLNDVLYKMPTIFPDLLGILIRTRIGKHLITGNVENAFHMIRLQESERNATRSKVKRYD